MIVQRNGEKYKFKNVAIASKHRKTHMRDAWCSHTDSFSDTEARSNADPVGKSSICMNYLTTGMHREAH